LKNMKIIILGASGKIGREIVRAMEPDHEVISASRGGDVQVDYTREASVRQMFDQIGKIDALVAVVGGDSVFKSYEELGPEDFEHGYHRKLMGQIGLVRSGIDFINDGGSITLSSGFLSHYPNQYSVATGPFNAAVDSFVHSAAPLLPRAIRLNVVSPAPVVDPAQVGRGVVTAEQAAAAYGESIIGDFSGRVIRTWGGLEDDPLPSY
jgi:NAD(P)-dependent dehydrogenase (short-subunit alcohol dehydrogenase family)